MSSSSTPTDTAAKPHPAPTEHGQVVADPLAHFKAIPWCAAILSDPAILNISVPDRRPLPNNESSLVRKTFNTPTTARACVAFVRLLEPASHINPSPSSGGTGDLSPSGGAAAPASPRSSSSSSSRGHRGVSASAALVSGGGRPNGEDARNPFALFGALVDLGPDCQSFPGVMHGGMHGVLMDEVMGTAANAQTENGAYTARFTTHFRRVIKLPQILLIQGRVVRKEGRKLHVRGTIEDKDGNIMAEGEGVWLAIERKPQPSKL